jgi:P4 family phage/plasmid primase-like protien
MSPAQTVPKPKKELLLKAALAYASLGMPVFPCFTAVHREGKPVACSCRKDCGNNCGKHPVIQHGHNNATVDESTIVSWWDKKYALANIGIRTGGKFFVVDLDPKNNGVENWNETFAGKAMPVTAECITGSGGRHIYFLIPDGVSIRNSTGHIGNLKINGVDIRGDGGYVIAPPSLHKSGRFYEWELSLDLLGEGKIAPPPEWLVSLLSAKPTSVPSGGAGGSVMFGEGERNEGLFNRGRSMRGQGFGDAVIRAAIFAMNETQCNPPISDPKEVETIIAQICKVPPGMSKEVSAKLAARAALQQPSQSQVAEPARPAVKQPRVEIVRPKNDDSLERGDQVELAELLISIIQGDAPCRPVFDRDDMWRFSPDNGLWQIVSESELISTSAKFAGMDVAGKELKLRYSDLVGIVKIAKASVAHSGFFSVAPKGIAFTNGFVTISPEGDIVMSPLMPDHRASAAMPFAYDSDAPCLRWLRYLDEVFSPSTVSTETEELIGSLEPKEAAMLRQQESETREEEISKSDTDRRLRIGMLQEHAGACLVGTVTDHAVAMTLTGGGANGKSVYLTVIRALFPRSTVVSISPQDFSNKFYLAELAGARLNAVNEMPDNEIADSAEFKSVVSGDSIMVARKRERPFELNPAAGHLFACNALPNARDLSEGFWRRFLVVTFDRHFSPSERDIKLADRIIQTELQGVAVWALRGAAALAARGSFEIAPSSLKARSEWKESSDQVSQFVQDATSETESDERMSVPEAYAAYRRWCRSTGHQCLSERKFSMRLSKVLVQKNSGKQRYYIRSIDESFRESINRPHAPPYY